jgi:signal transduction histidine kinase
MTIHDVYLICFAAGSVIHGAQTMLAAKLGRHRTGAGRILAFDGLVVEDTGLGHPSASRHRGTGIGLTNLRQRLQHLYGIGRTLMLEEMTLGRTRAVLTLPQLVGVQS